ncbi:MAG: DUF177 domain-containing protein [Rikenellaceae bacterium]
MGKSSNRDYIIPIKGLSIGKHQYSFSIDTAFFEDFENSDILNASLVVELMLEKAATWIKLGSKIKGEVGVECDRCLDEFKLPVNTTAGLLVKFVRSEDDTDDDGIITLDPTESELDLKQFFYDYICLALPLKKIHKQGGCNPEMIARLKSVTGVKNSTGNGSPFDKLKNLLN